jgi:acetyl-CoA C-acetyltransferase
VRDVVIASAARTPIGKFMGGLSGLRAPELGGHAIRAALERAGVAPEAVEEVIMGCVLQAGLGQNPARQAAIKAKVPTSVGAFTVNKVCGSGLKSVMLAAQAIRAGDADLIVAGGMESMSNAPHILPKSREGFRLGHAQLLDSMIHDGLWDIYNDFHMGATAELVAKKYGISRAEQDEYALGSHRKAVAAEKAGKFRAEIAPVELPQKKGPPLAVEKDEGPRADASLEALAKLKPAFQAEGGTVTAGNASTINDGAAALVVASAEKARAMGLRPLAKITGYATGGRDPEWVMMAPIEAVKRLLALTGRRSAAEYDLVELNEAFAVQAVALQRELEIPPARLNVNGGAVAMGHPIGASGARILTTLLHAMKDRGARTGLAALCLGGGNAVALSVEAIEG